MLLPYTGKFEAYEVKNSKQRVLKSGEMAVDTCSVEGESITDFGKPIVAIASVPNSSTHMPDVGHEPTDKTDGSLPVAAVAQNKAGSSNMVTGDRASSSKLPVIAVLIVIGIGSALIVLKNLRRY